jgi:lysine 6-dehydrogenase
LRVLVLGGCGIQGKAAVLDLAGSPAVERVICADADLEDSGKYRIHRHDQGPHRDLDAGIRSPGTSFPAGRCGHRPAPRQFLETVCQAAIRTGISVVNTNYADPIAHLHENAQNAGMAILPECGLDPGIDLIICGEARRRFDALNVINSYCGGFPEPAACDNPLNYKVSWVFEGVLASTKRDGRIIRDGAVIDIPGDHQHDEEYVHEVDFPGLGTLEAIPNGNAVFFTDALGVTATIRETGRYSCAGPVGAHSGVRLKQLGFLSEDPVAGLPGAVSPYQMMDKLLAPQLQYKRSEKDLVAMLNVFEGRQSDRQVRLTSRLLIERDLDTGLMAMAQGVGYPASIAAQMIAKGEIIQKGVLSPMKHIPYPAFRNALHTRGIVIEEEITLP